MVVGLLHCPSITYGSASGPAGCSAHTCSKPPVQYAHYKTSRRERKTLFDGNTRVVKKHYPTDALSQSVRCVDCADGPHYK